MACRLCFKRFFDKNGVSIFVEESNEETELARMICLHLQININAEDSISTEICETCYNALRDFHSFWEYVDEQQNLVREGFQEVKFIEDETEEFEQEADDVTLRTSDVGINTTKACSSIDSKRAQIIEECSIAVSEPETSSEERVEEPRKYFHCEYCGKGYEKAKYLSRHVRIIHEKRPYGNYYTNTCKVCGKRYKKEDSLEEHMLTHTENGQASTLDETETSNKNLECETITHECMVCDKRFRNETSLKIHSHCHEQKYFRCTECRVVYRNLAAYKKHISAVHAETEQRKPFCCKVCGKGYEKARFLHRHVRMIHENRPYGTYLKHSCKDCGKRFKHLDSLEEHMLEHQGIPVTPVQCEVCQVWVKNRKVLRNHSLIHKKLDLTCEICGKSVTSVRNLKRHQRDQHNPANIFSCQQCGKVLTNAVIFKEHMAQHKGINLYKCPYCPKETRSRTNMYAHFKHTHVDEWIEAKKSRTGDVIQMFLTNVDEKFESD